MLRSLSFVLDGTVTTRVCVTGNLDGTLSFEFTVLGAGNAAALEAVFISLNRPLPVGGFRVYGDAGLSLGPCVAEGTDTLGRAATLTQPVVDALGQFDIGITFGRSDPAAPDARLTGFTLAHETAVLSLDMFGTLDFGLRYRRQRAIEMLARAVGDPRAFGRIWPAREALEVIEIRAAGLRRPDGDPESGAVVAIDCPGTQDVFAGLAREQSWWSGDRPQPSDDEFSSTAPLGRWA